LILNKITISYVGTQLRDKIEGKKLVCFDIGDDTAYYTYIPQSTDLKIIFDVKIEDVYTGLLDQGGLEPKRY